MEDEYFFIDNDDRPNTINENHIANGSFPLSTWFSVFFMIN